LATYPPKMTLPYRLDARYVEGQTLAGDLIEPVQIITIEVDALGSDQLRARAKALYMNIDTRPFQKHGTVEVISSGIEVWGQKRVDGRVIRMHAPIVAKIGPLPLLSAPVSDPVELIEAYEQWIEAYVEPATGAMTEWLAAWTTDDDPDDEGYYPNGATAGTFVTTMFFRINGKERHIEVDGRFDTPDHFRRARAAHALYSFASNIVSEEDWQFALRTVGRGAEVQGQWESGDADLTIQAYEDYAARIAAVAFARSWSRQRGREGFDLEMRRWATEHGSDRLRMGLADGYRMVPVYLQERIGSEAPGFYAYLPKDNDDVSWQPRTGPSESALVWRRAIEAEIVEHCPPGMPAPAVEIVWMKEPPEEMLDESELYYESSPGYMERVEVVPFEAIAVPGWLGRYTLIAGVYSEDATVAPRTYIRREFVLVPKKYELRSVPEPPLPESDIPIDTGDFETAPVRPGAADDDIPF
jgi:hypothetical protein